MKFTRREFFLIAACIVLSAYFIYDVRFAPRKPAAYRGPASGDIEVWAFEGDADALETVAVNFRRTEPGVTVRIRRLLWSEGHAEIRKAMAENRLPDVIQLGTTWIPELAHAGALLPLDSYYYGSSSFAPTDLYLSSKRSSLNLDDRRMYSLPFTVETRLLVYNRALLAELGFEKPPASWDDVRRVQSALRRKAPGATTCFIPRYDVLFFLPFVWQNNADIFDWVEGRFTFGDERVAEALTEYNRLFASGAIVDYDREIKPRTGEDLLAAFRAGKIAMFLAGPWILRSLSRGELAGFEEKTATAPVPALHYPVSFLGGTHWVITRGARHPEAAWRFIEYTMQPEAQVRFFQMTGSLAARRNAWDGPWIEPDANLKSFITQAFSTNTVPPVPCWETVSDSLIRVLKSSGTDTRRNRAMLEALDAEANALLESGNR